MTTTALTHSMTEDDMDAIDAALEGAEVQGPSLTGSSGRRCRRHEWIGVTCSQRDCSAQFHCSRCGLPRDEARAKRGKSARQRGNAYERELAKKLGGRRTGMYGGPDDVTVSDLFVIQSKVRKAFPRWMADELAKLPRTGGRIPLLVVADAPGSSGRRTALVVVKLGDWIGLHGPVAQRDDGGGL